MEILREEQIFISPVTGENRRQGQGVRKAHFESGCNQLLVRQHFPGRKPSRHVFVRCPPKCQENALGAVLLADVDKPGQQLGGNPKSPALLLVELRRELVVFDRLRAWLAGNHRRVPI